MKNDLAYAHGSDWDEVEVTYFPEWIRRNREDDDYEESEEEYGYNEDYDEDEDD
jgi:hypothetical protein